MKKTLLLLAAIVFAVTACNKSTYVDGTYSAEFDAPDSRGWQAFVQFTLTEDAISDVDFDYYDANMNRKSEDTAYNSRMLSITGVTNPEMYSPAIEANIANATIVPAFDSIDIVTGATHSCHDANILVEAALESAADGGETEVTVVQPDPAK
jgi:major membrane immunogen (membrane-anchored lipoprotein)